MGCMCGPFLWIKFILTKINHDGKCYNTWKQLYLLMAKINALEKCFFLFLIFGAVGATTYLIDSVFAGWPLNDLDIQLQYLVYASNQTGAQYCEYVGLIPDIMLFENLTGLTIMSKHKLWVFLNVVFVFWLMMPPHNYKRLVVECKGNTN